MQKLSWYDILEAARKLSPDGSRNFIASDLVAAAGLRDTDKSTASQIATAWLAKLVRWKYVVVVGKVDGESGRPTSSYVLTDSGRTCELREGQSSMMGRLLEAVRAYQKARGGKGDTAAYAQLIKVTDEVQK